MFRFSSKVATLGAAAMVAVTLALVTGSEAGASGPAPGISSFSPSSAAVGSEVTITGTNLSGATDVAFNLVDAPITSDTGTQIMVTVPLGQDSGPVTVTTPGGTATSATVFTLQGFYITTATLPDAQRGVQYQEELQSAGGTGPFHWSEKGALPKGMSMTNGGMLSGIPNLKKDKAGAYPLTLRVRDSTRHGHLVATENVTLTLT